MSPGASGTARTRQRGYLVIGACPVARLVGRYVAGRAAPACEAHCSTPRIGHAQRRHRVLPFPRVGAEPNSPTGEQTGNVTEAGASLPSPSRRANVTSCGERDRCCSITLDRTQAAQPLICVTRPKLARAFIPALGLFGVRANATQIRTSQLGLIVRGRERHRRLG